MQIDSCPSSKLTGDGISCPGGRGTSDKQYELNKTSTESSGPAVSDTKMSAAEPPGPGRWDAQPPGSRLVRPVHTSSLRAKIGKAKPFFFLFLIDTDHCRPHKSEL